MSMTPDEVASYRTWLLRVSRHPEPGNWPAVQLLYELEEKATASDWLFDEAFTDHLRFSRRIAELVEAEDTDPWSREAEAVAAAAARWGAPARRGAVPRAMGRNIRFTSGARNARFR